ncbi:hypothetical protein GCM10022414_30220 [Zhongshania borealis]|uniref:SDR family NAD(P)-dependent oxidoreductase n=1 Tax=Zhongshania borealis TaxID=889488 RepID=A0ABP7X1S5_9GAMM
MTAERVVLVTGASRGAGKGIALALSRPGSVIYITGRTLQEGDADLPGSLANTAAEIKSRGATARAIACDQSHDQEVESLFAVIEKEQGRLDILVNNALLVPQGLILPSPFW